jgi:hypothetical protein
MNRVVMRGEGGRFLRASARSTGALAAFNPSAPRLGRVALQCKRAFIAHDFKPLSMRELREWCYPGRPRRHWFYINIKRALRRLGARQIGRAGGSARPALYATYSRHDK